MADSSGKKDQSDSEERVRDELKECIISTGEKMSDKLKESNSTEEKVSHELEAFVSTRETNISPNCGTVLSSPPKTVSNEGLAEEDKEKHNPSESVESQSAAILQQENKSNNLSDNLSKRPMSKSTCLNYTSSICIDFFLSNCLQI